MLTITPREALSLVAGRRVTVYRHAQISTKLALRILQCHHESTGAGPDCPWPLTVSYDASTHRSKRAPIHPYVARALWERTVTPRHLRRRLYSPSYTITPRDLSPVAGP